MDPIDFKETEDIGWHLIARGGDMTARVHPAMRLGVLPSGDLSFEAPDAVVAFDRAGEALTLQIVDEDYELETEAGERTRTIRVSAQTHVCLDLLGHTLDIDNDFAIASPPGDALALFVVRKGQPRPALRAVPVEYLNSEHAAARAEERPAAPADKGRSGVWKVVAALAGSALIIAGLAAVALYFADRSFDPQSVMGPVAPSPVTERSSSVVAIPAAGRDTGVETEAPESPVSSSGMEPVLSAELLARFSDLLEAEPLPDKATVDFAVESLRSLMAAYPNDPRVPEALTRLNERLVLEARRSYDDGDAFQAGRLIEQAARLGMAEASVAETLAYFDGQQPGRTAGGQSEPGDGARADGSRPPQETTELSTATTEPNIEAANAGTTAETATVGESPAEDGLDTLVESATGVALGALAVTVEDTEPASTAASNHSGTLDSGAATPGVSANELPDGFALEVPVRMPTQDSESPEEPVFQPYSQLTPRRQVPLAYPRRAAETAVGSIVVEFIVTETGEVTDVSVRGDVPPLFLREAVRTVRQWRFEPVEKNGQLVPVRTALRVTYRG